MRRLRALWPASGLRLLPCTIGCMALLAMLKLVQLGSGLGVEALQRAGRAVLPPAVAAGHEATPAAKPAAAPPAAPPAAPASAPPAPPALPPPDPGPSPAERAILLDLRARRTAMEERAQALEAREALLAAAERRLTERVQQLTALQSRLEALDQTRRERDEANWRSLVKTYETMRPRDAAAIFNELEQPVLIQVLDRMKEAKVAPILAAMQPERARTATSELARWRSRQPEPQG